MKKLEKLTAWMKKNPKTLGTVTAVSSMLAAGAAFAITVPAAGSFGYEAYHVMDQFLTGGFGYAVGAGACGYGGYLAIQNKGVPAAVTFVGGGLFLAANSIVTSLGAII